MSQENVEVVLEGIRRFESFDFDGVTRLWHPDSRITAAESWPEQGPFEGRDAVIGEFRRLAADWEQVRISDVEVVLDRADWVVVTFRSEMRGGKTGAPPPAAASLAVAYRVMDGQIREAHLRWSLEQALEAAGLRE